ncbi:hypothetical protein D3C81_2045740 [compost metagenome]
MRSQPFLRLVRPVLAPLRQRILRLNVQAGFVLHYIQERHHAGVPGPFKKRDESGIAQQAIGRRDLAVEGTMSSH